MTDKSMTKPGKGEDLQALAYQALERRAMIMARRGSGAAPIETDADYFPVSQDGQALSNEELHAWIKSAQAEVNLRMVGLGVAYLLLKAQVGDNQFSAALRDLGIARGNAYTYMAVARMYAQAPEEVVPTLVQVPGFRSNAALARLPQPLINKMAASGALAELATMSDQDRSRELTALKRMHDDLAKQKQRVAEHQNKINDLLLPRKMGHMLPWVHSARSEAPAWAASAMDSVAQLRRLYQTATDGSEIKGRPDEVAEQQQAVIMPLLVSLQAVAAQAAELLREMAEQGHALPETGAEALAELLPAEVHAYRTRLDMITRISDQTARTMAAAAMVPTQPPPPADKTKPQKTTPAGKKTAKKAAKKTAKKARSA